MLAKLPGSIRVKNGDDGHCQQQPKVIGVRLRRAAFVRNTEAVRRFSSLPRGAIQPLQPMPHHEPRASLNLIS